MAYDPTVWQGGKRPPAITPAALNKMEQGIKAAHDLAADSGTSVTLGKPVRSSVDLPASGAVGEGRIAQDTGRLWQWDGAAWVDLGPVQGPPGTIGLIESEREGIFVPADNFPWRWDTAAGRRLLVSDPVDGSQHAIYTQAQVDAAIAAAAPKDTGWRDLSAMVPGRRAGAVRLRRIGQTVWLEVDGLVLDNPSTTFAQLNTLIPSGFRPRGTSYYPAAPVSVSHALGGIRVTVTNGDLTLYRVRDTAAGAEASLLTYAHTTWPTDNAWPANLPGAPA